ncbi:MAG: flavin reductase family protein [Clostridia bacterium]|nr:flavin reductase family protein [Clostridia bacterium]
MSKVAWKGGTLLAPVPPVLVSVGDGEKSNVFTVAWTGLINTQPPKTYISVRPSRYSYDFIKSTDEFALNLTPASLVRAADWCGIHTGRKVDKFKKMNLTPVPASKISAPIIEECPLSLECRVFDVKELGTHHMFLADIVAVDVDGELIDSKGKLHIDRADLAAFAHGEYFSLGKSLGTFGFSVKKKKKRTSPAGSKPVDKTHRKV